ncbi:hypothetical protein ACXO4I_04790 [Lactobacillus delbrueckii subsp. bulgaricus]|uniref:hypothetical protein n=1 Tax=Lactobacillus delbrueckii TaxID=1584 RepID=UPI0022EBEFFA|nr:hypothetical protein [Lactobacillus delbrueckii]MDA3801924.1 hypothetical protein [Lactobacillus delbrueckii]
MFAIVSAYHQFEQKTFSGDCLFMFYTFFVFFSGDRDPGSERGSFADDIIDDYDLDVLFAEPL